MKRKVRIRIRQGKKPKCDAGNKTSGGELERGNCLRKLTRNRLKWSFLACSETSCCKHKRWSEAPSPVRVEPEAHAAASRVLIALLAAGQQGLPWSRTWAAHLHIYQRTLKRNLLSETFLCPGCPESIHTRMPKNQISVFYILCSFRRMSLSAFTSDCPQRVLFSMIKNHLRHLLQIQIIS